MSTPDEESSHFQLLKSLERTFDDGRRNKKHAAPTRTEARKEIGEFSFNSAPTSSLSMDAILQSLEDEGETDKKRNSKNAKSAQPLVSKQKSKTLPKPLEKPVAQKINRTVLYDNLKKEISKWNAVVYHNRTSDQLVFPLSASKKAPRKTTKAAASEFVPETPLEEEMARILHGDDYVKKKKAEIHEKEPLASEQQTYAMTVAEAMEKHNEMARLRALQSYEQIKARRQSKIKSKKYHRLLRREKIRKQLKEFEQLQKTDPEAALLKLEELDKARVQERMSLKHRNTSKWAKMHAVRAKYDKESRSALSDQLKISRELTKKVEMEATDEEDGDDYDLDIPSLVKSSLTNPWVLDPSVKDNEKVHLYYTGYKKFWQEVNDRKEKDRQKKLHLEKMKNLSPKKRLDSENGFQNEIDSHAESEPTLIEATYENKKQLGTEAKSMSTRQKKLQKRNKLKKKIETKINEYVQSKIVVGKDEDVTVDLLDSIMDAAEDKLKMKAMTHLEALGKVAEKGRKSVEKKLQPKRKPKNTKGDADEVRELSVDKSKTNYEESSSAVSLDSDNTTVNLRSMRKDETSIATNVRKSQKDTTAAVRKTIDPANFLQFGKTPTFDMGTMNDEYFVEGAEDQPEDPEEERLKIIAEAFEDDDLLEEFKKKKQVEVEESTPKDVNLALPGWGDWGGKDIKPNLRKRKRFTIKAPPAPPRKDALLSHVILNEDANSKLRPHQVRALPFPFKRVQDFEKMIRAPVGRTWLPEPAMKSLIAPKIITRLGAVIQPIDEDALVSKTELKAKELQLTGVKRFPKRQKLNLKSPT